MQDQEYEVSFKDLFAYCFMHWRSAIVIVLCGVLLGAGHILYKARKSAASAAASAQAAANDEQSGEISAVNDAQNGAIVAQYENLAERLAYYDGSLYMKIDPNNEYVACSTIVISVASSWNSDTLKAAYAAYDSEMWSGEAVKRVAEEMGTTQAYLRELASFKTVETETDSSGATSIVVEQTEENSGSNSMVLTLKAIGASEEDAVALRDALLEDMQALKASISDTVGAHDFVVVSSTTYSAVDYSLLDKQASVANSISANRQTIATNEKNIKTALASSSTVTGTSTTRVSKKALVKRGILGGAAAFLAYGFILCLRYLLGGAPEVKSQVASRYGLPDLGSYADGCQKYHRHSFVFDRWLRKLMGMAEPMDESSVEAMVAANVKLYAGDAKSIMVSSSVGSERAGVLTDRLAALVPDRTFVCANGLTSNVASREQLESTDAVVLVEEYGKSEFTVMDATLALLADAGKKPLGLVMA